MNLLSIAQQMDTRLATLPLLNAHYIGARASVTTPCSIVLLPEQIEYQQTYSSGVRRIPNWEIVVLTGMVDDIGAPDRILSYAGDEEGSVVYALETPGDPFTAYTGVDSVMVKSCEFGVIDWQKQQFQGATFVVDVMAS